MVETTAPITANDVKDLDHAPYVIDGDLKIIFFESEQSKADCLGIEVGKPATRLPERLDNPAPIAPSDVSRT